MADPRIARVILFAKDIAAMAAFYRDVVGLSPVATPDDSEDWRAFDAGGCQLALHAIPARYAEHIEITTPPEPREGSPMKVAFFAPDVAAAREALVRRGARMGEVQRFGDLVMCDGVDPEGNVFQFANRA